MIESLIAIDQCSRCKICCIYDNDDLWDAPSFSKQEWKAIPQKAREKVSFTVGNKLWYPELIQIGISEFACPFLGENGCTLLSNKPFKCALWPLYVVETIHGNAVVYSNVCPNITRSEEVIRETLGTHFFERLRSIVAYNPEFIEPMREHFSLVCLLDSINGSASDNHILSGDA